MSSSRNAPPLPNMDDVFNLLQSNEPLSLEDQALLEQFSSTVSNDDTGMFPQLEGNANRNQMNLFGNLPAIPPGSLPTMPFDFSAIPQIPFEPTQNSMLTAPIGGLYQNMIPDQSMGPSFDPRIGWYFPALPLSGVQTPRDPFLVSEGYMPMIPTVPSRITTSNATMPAAKSKFGPAAYLQQHVKKRLASASKSSTPHPLGNDKDPLIVKQCTCSDKEATKIKRPKNAWILYRSANAPRIAQELNQHDAKAISRIAAERWKQESANVREQYFQMAEKEKAQHKEMYPDYKFKQGATRRNTFGSASCTCGAYQANLAAMGMIDQPGNADDAADSYALPIHQRKGKAPVAQMARVPIPDVSTLGLATETQRAQAAEYAANLKRRREEAAEHDEPRAKRRSARERKSVVYTESSENDIFQSESVDSTLPNFEDFLPPSAFGSPSDSLPPIPTPFISDEEWENLFGYQITGNELMRDEDESIGDNTVVARPACQIPPDSPAMGTRSRAKSSASGPASPTTPLRRSARQSTSR